MDNSNIRLFQSEIISPFNLFKIRCVLFLALHLHQTIWGHVKVHIPEWGHVKVHIPEWGHVKVHNPAWGHVRVHNPV